MLVTLDKQQWEFLRVQMTVGLLEMNTRLALVLLNLG
jgi:hypothetical protein